LFADGSQWEFTTGEAVCESCGEATAAIHLVKIEGGEIVHRHLCPDCAELSVEEPESAAVIFAVPTGLGNLLGRLAEQGAEIQKAGEGLHQVCPICSTTLSDLRETGLAGCPDCYQTHSGEIESALYAGREPLQHVGKVPQHAPESLRLRREVLRLERMMDELVEDERFEEAAGVRDRLGELSQQMREVR
jgi:protein arginine kinase activator